MAPIMHWQTTSQNLTLVLYNTTPSHWDKAQRPLPGLSRGEPRIYTLILVSFKTLVWADYGNKDQTASQHRLEIHEQLVLCIRGPHRWLDVVWKVTPESNHPHFWTLHQRLKSPQGPSCGYGVLHCGRRTVSLR